MTAHDRHPGRHSPAPSAARAPVWLCRARRRRQRRGELRPDPRPARRAATPSSASTIRAPAAHRARARRSARTTWPTSWSPPRTPRGWTRSRSAGFSLGGPIAIRAAGPPSGAGRRARADRDVRSARMPACAWPPRIWRDLYESGDHAAAGQVPHARRVQHARSWTAFADRSSMPSVQRPRRTASRPARRSTPNSSSGSTSATTWPTSGYPRWSSPRPAIRWCPLDLQQQLAAAYPDARLAEIDSGHLPMAERPEQWQQLHHHVSAMRAVGPRPSRSMRCTQSSSTSFGGPDVLESRRGRPARTDPVRGARPGPGQRREPGRRDGPVRCAAAARARRRSSSAGTSPAWSRRSCPASPASPSATRSTECRSSPARPAATPSTSRCRRASSPASPPSIDHAHAAALPLVGLTAWHSLVDVAHI